MIPLAFTAPSLALQHKILMNCNSKFPFIHLTNKLKPHYNVIYCAVQFSTRDLSWAPAGRI